MQYGMPTLIEHGDLQETIDLCKALELDFIELNMNMPQYQIDRIGELNLSKQVSEGIGFTIHLDENLNVWDFNPRVANAYMETVLSTIEVAKAIQIPILNMHMQEGVYFTLPEKRVYLFEGYKEIYLDKTRVFRSLCETAVGKHPIHICIENTHGYPDFVKEAVDILLESPVFGLTFDIGHSHSAGDVDETYLMSHRDKLYHMHVHDAIGESNHLAVGTGEIHMLQRLRLAEACQCSCVLETKTVRGLKESVHNLAKLQVHLRK